MLAFRHRTVLGLFFTLALGGLSSFAAGDPWSASEVIQPEKLVHVLKSAPKAKQPVLLHVGFPFLYRNGHIPGSIYAGPTNEKEGIDHLRSELAKVPRSREVVIYCGCCPMDKCPNIRPAFEEAKAMGFKKVRILSLPDNFKENWIDKGYPTEK